MTCSVVDAVPIEALSGWFILLLRMQGLPTLVLTGLGYLLVSVGLGGPGSEVS